MKIKVIRYKEKTGEVRVIPSTPEGLKWYINKLKTDGKIIKEYELEVNDTPKKEGLRVKEKEIIKKKKGCSGCGRKRKRNKK